MKNDKDKIKSVIPFLNWAGGKRWLVSSCKESFPKNYNAYIEPFLGSGAVFFGIQPHTAILSDMNPDLMETYQAIKDDWEKVEKALREHHKKHSKEYYYKMRDSRPRTAYSKAANFIYLNRTCWNGLYRVNLKGKFNVPIGTKENVILDTDNFEKISNILSNAKLFSGDFEEIIEKSSYGDLLFVDPPYTVKHNFNNFIKYNEKLFKWDDQIRLRNCLLRAKERGVHIFGTNANHDSVKDLYQKEFNLNEVQRNSLIASESRRRGKIQELFIRG